MNIDRGLISHLLYSEDIDSLVKELYLISHTFSATNKPVYDYIIRHYEKYRKAPSVETLQETFPKITFEEPKEPEKFYLDKAREQKLETQIKKVLNEADEYLAKGDVYNARTTVISAATNVERSLIKNNDIHIVKSLPDWMENYKEIRDTGHVKGLSMGLDTLDKLTNGIQDGDFIIIAARPGSFKTFFLCYLLDVAAKECEDCNILFFSKEMTKEQIYHRYLSLSANINYNALRKYELTNDELTKIQHKVEENIKANPIIIGKGEYEKFDANYVKSKIIEYDPRVVYIDGMYLMEQSPGWEDQTGMTRKIREISLDTEVPIVGTVQLNKKNEIAYSDSYLQDATIVLHLTREEDKAAQKRTNTTLISVPKYREGESDIRTYFTIGFRDMKLVEGKEDPDGMTLLEEAIGVDLS